MKHQSWIGSQISQVSQFSKKDADPAGPPPEKISEGIMRKRRCQKLQKVLHWEIITLMAQLQALVLPAEDSSFSHFSDQREFVLQTSSFSLLRTAGGRLSFRNLLNFQSTVGSGVTEPITMLTVVFILTLNTCRWSAVFLTVNVALPTGAGLMYLPICSADTIWSSSSDMMNMMQLDWFINTTLVVYGKPFSWIDQIACKCAWIWTRPD